MPASHTIDKAAPLSERANHRVQPALVASGLVLVDDPFRYHRIDYRDGRDVTRGCRFLVTGFHRLDDILDVRTHFRAQRHIVAAAFLALAGALLRRFDIGHSKNRVNESKPQIISLPEYAVNDLYACDVRYG